MLKSHDQDWPRDQNLDVDLEDLVSFNITRNYSCYQL